MPNDDVTLETPPTGTPPAETPPTGTPPVAKTLVSGADDTKPPAPQTWPDDWRTHIAGDDAKELKRLERFGSPNDMFTAYRSLEGKLSQAQKAEPLSADATPEEIANYRELTGVPEKPDGYFDTLPEGLVLSDTDKAIAGSYLESMHAKNMPPAAVHQGLQWYQETLEAQAAEQGQQDMQARSEAAQSLKEEYGGEYGARLNAVANLLETAPPLEDGTPLASILENARLPDGRLIGDSPAMIKFFADLAYQLNPAGFVSPAGDVGQLDSVTTELKELRGQMANPKSAYWKDPKKQERYRTLLSAEERLG
jgi:hypothetical protein